MFILSSLPLWEVILNVFIDCNKVYIILESESCQIKIKWLCCFEAFFSMNMHRFIDLHKHYYIFISKCVCINIHLNIFGMLLGCALWEYIINMFTLSFYYQIVFDNVYN